MGHRWTCAFYFLFLFENFIWYSYFPIYGRHKNGFCGISHRRNGFLPDCTHIKLGGFYAVRTRHWLCPRWCKAVERFAEHPGLQGRLNYNICLFCNSWKKKILPLAVFSTNFFCSCTIRTLGLKSGIDIVPDRHLIKQRGPFRRRRHIRSSVVSGNQRVLNRWGRSALSKTAALFFSLTQWST